jgi:hypothetical protein
MAFAGVDVTVQAGIRPARFASVKTAPSSGSPSGRSRPMYVTGPGASFAATVRSSGVAAATNAPSLDRLPQSASTRSTLTVIDLTFAPEPEFGPKRCGVPITRQDGWRTAVAGLAAKARITLVPAAPGSSRLRAGPKVAATRWSDALC